MKHCNICLISCRCHGHRTTETRPLFLPRDGRFFRQLSEEYFSPSLSRKEKKRDPYATSADFKPTQWSHRAGLSIHKYNAVFHTMSFAAFSSLAFPTRANWSCIFQSGLHFPISGLAFSVTCPYLTSSAKVICVMSNRHLHSVVDTHLLWTVPYEHLLFAVPPSASTA